MEIRERLAALRAAMVEEGLDAYVVPSSDPHQSETPPARWRTREWISGFDGSAGTVVVTPDRAGLWTDFRYHELAENQIAGTGIELHRVGDPGVSEYTAWLATELRGGTVGYDGTCLSARDAYSLEEVLRGTGITVRATSGLIDGIWSDRPHVPHAPIEAFDPRYAGESRGEKLSNLRNQMTDIGAEHHVLSTLDDIAWLLNIRGTDIRHIPVGVCHLIISRKKCELFIEPGKVPPDLRSELESDGVTGRDYDEFLDSLADLSGSVLVSPSQVSMAVFSQLGEGATRIEKENPTTLTKARKNSTELGHIRQAMIRDGVAMVRFLHWLGTAVETDEVTEFTAAGKLEEFRRGGRNFVGPSFTTISAYRGHGAMPHYSTSPESDCLLEPAGLYLVDSGGQYLDGTTDITRTVSLGEPTGDERKDYTLVLKGHIALSRLRFPAGTTGPLIDAVARQPMWNEGINFGHGTGHGVGFYLMVHEGPQRINQSNNDVRLESGMLISNEPGIYRPGLHGVRIENLVVVSEPERTDFGAFHSFETVTLCPYDRTLIDVDLLTGEEIEWIDDYHRVVRDKLLGQLDEAAGGWLEDACRPLE